MIKLSSDSILTWLENNYNDKIKALEKESQIILEQKELEFKNEMITKAHDYRDVKFENIMNENKIGINNLLMKFRYNKDLLIEKKISEIIQSAKDSLKELLEIHPNFSIFYYSNLINFISKNFPTITTIYCPIQTEQFFSQFTIGDDKIQLIGSDKIDTGIIGIINKDQTLIYFSPEVMYENNKNEIRNAIFKILLED